MTDMTFMLTSDIDSQVKRTCEILGFPDLITKIRWRWNARLTRSIGRATYRKMFIDLSTKLFMLLSPTQRRDTIIHEVCHLIAYHKYVTLLGRRIKGHGKEWKMLMRLAGGTPKACSKKIDGVEQFRRNVKRVVYYCKCREHEITPKKAAKIDCGAIWFCRTCRANLARVPYAKDPFMKAAIKIAAETVKPPRAEDTRASILAEIEALKRRNEMMREIERLKAENVRLQAQQKK